MSCKFKKCCYSSLNIISYQRIAMLKPSHCTTEPAKRRMQVAIELPPEVEVTLRNSAKEGFRSVSKEIAMRLIQSVKSSNQEQHAKAAA